MKVLHVIASVDPRGGGPIEGVVSSARVWSEQGHERHVLSIDAADDPWVIRAPVPTIAVGPRRRWTSGAKRALPWLRYGYSPALVRWLRLNAGQYDAVIVNGLWNFSSYGTWLALRDGTVPYFVFPHGMLDPWFGQAYPVKHVFKKLFWRLFEHKVLQDATGVLFTAEEERRLARLSFAPYRCREFVVGYGTQDIPGDPHGQREAFMARLPRMRGRKFILSLGRIHPKKGIDLLIGAYARLAHELPDTDLVIAGPDQTGWRGALEALARERGVADRIHFSGMVSGDEKWGAFRAADCFVLPSHQENFGLVAAEAMALGLPLVITNKVNIWREVAEDGAGIVVDDTLDGVTDGLRRINRMSTAEREAMGRMARACFQKRYDLKNNAMGLLALMESLLRQPPAGSQQDRS